MKILFGSIITSGRGKIGGQFVKRMPNGHSLNNLPSSKSAVALRNNPRIVSSTRVFSAWNSLIPSERSAWNLNASLTPVVDAFGNSKYLTGRQFFIKCTMQAAGSPFPFPAPAPFTSVVEMPLMEIGFFEYDADTMNFTTAASVSSATYLLRVDKIPNKSRVPRFINSKILGSGDLAESDTVNIFDPIFEKYGFVGQQSIFNVSFVFINSNGWISAPQCFVVGTAG